MKNETNKESLFSVFDFTVGDVDEAIEESKNVVVKSKSICICGHADGFHSFSDSLGWGCSANKSNCKCKKKRLVLICEDTRNFLRKTTGPGAFHALAQGIRDAESRGQKLEWIETPVCEPCGSVDGLSPVPVNERGIIVEEDKGFNVWLCSDCRKNRS
jgi:hypothetical protein